MVKTTDELKQTKKQRKVVVSVVATAIVAATPGVYGAYQGAKQEWKEKLQKEQTIRDKQEQDLQGYVKVNKIEIDGLKNTVQNLRNELSTTHTQLVSVLLLLGQQTHRSVVTDAVRKLAKKSNPVVKAPFHPKRPSLKLAPLVRQLEQRKR
jgi:hypothetical protein